MMGVDILKDYLISGVGILVSIIIYLLTYKQTIGAKKERTIAANEEVVKILIRRIVNEDFELNLQYIYWLMEGKARDFKIKVRDLYTQEEILNSVFTKILESDFLSVEQRKLVINQISVLILSLKENEPNQEKQVMEKESLFSKLILPITTALLGPLLAFLTDSILDVGLNLDRISISLTFLISTLITFIISFILRFKDTSKEVLPLNHMTKVIEEGVSFEKEVVRRLNEKFNIIPSENKFFDYKIPEKEALIEVKVWKETVHPQAIRRMIEKLQKAIEDKEGTVAIIIVKYDNELFDKFITPTIKILNLENTIEELSK